MWVIFNNYGSTMTLGLQYDDETQLKKRIELMSRIANSENVVVHEEIPFPPCAFRFKRSDLEIIRCVQGSPTMTYSEVGRQLQLSIRTVRRRLNTMVREGALFSTLDYDLSKSTGFVIMTIIVEHASAKTSVRTEEEIVSKFGERIFGSVLGSPRMSYFALILDNIAQEDAIKTSIEGLDDVRRVYTDLTEEVIGLFGAFREPVNRLLEKTVESTPVERLRGRQLSAPRLPGIPLRP